MGRKSLARERGGQILDAFEACIVERGLDESSIAAIAEQANVERTLVHHYFGSREALVKALVERLVDSYERDRDDALARLPETNREEALLDYLFGPDFGDPRRGVLFDELFAAANRNPRTRALLLGVYRDFEELVCAEIEKARPDAPARARREVAHAIMGHAEMASRFARLGFPAARRRGARRSVEALIATLGPPRSP